MADGRLLVRAPAKLNLCLHVGPRRADGYHELDSIVAKITLYDELLLGTLENGNLELHCDCRDAGDPQQNLALRAARLLKEYTGAAAGARIELRKHIAVGAGLGGGSSDAAAALVGLNKLWATGLEDSELLHLAAQLGSDVPLFLAGPISRMRGRGETLTPITLKPFWAVLLCPPVSCPTPQVYAAYDRQPAKELVPVDLDRLVAFSADEWPGFLRNDLYLPARQVCPSIALWAKRLGQATGGPVLLTGSGSALFLTMSNFSKAILAHSKLDADLVGLASIVTVSI
jgi:4-diphosphocytidyl-2-C-methyl-D-erythritol kinase